MTNLIKKLHINPLIFLLSFWVFFPIKANAQACPSVSADTTIATSCSTGISWTGGNLNVGNGSSGSITVSNTSGDSIHGSGQLGSLNITANSTVFDNQNATNGIYFVTGATIPSLVNAGTINTTSYKGDATFSHGTITTLTNSGSITTSGDLASGINNATGGTITTLTNSGSITTSGNGSYGIFNIGAIDTLTNTGTIFGSSGGINNETGGTVNNISNVGTISTNNSLHFPAVDNYAVIGSLSNTGVISAVGNDTAGFYNEGGGCYHCHQ